MKRHQNATLGAERGGFGIGFYTWKCIGLEEKRWRSGGGGRGIGICALQKSVAGSGGGEGKAIDGEHL